LIKDEIYFCLKKKIKTKSDTIQFSEVCDIYFEDEIRIREIENISFPLNLGINKIDSLTIVKKIKEINKAVSLINIGETECIVLKEKEQKGKMKSVILLMLAVVVLFFGGAITIVNFHADVNMPQVHENVYRLFGGAGKPSVWLGVFYSLGLFIGFVSILSVFSKSNKTPGLLDIELFMHKDEVLTYKKEEEEREEV
jgi:stage V sporulation protein AA